MKLLKAVAFSIAFGAAPIVVASPCAAQAPVAQAPVAQAPVAQATSVAGEWDASMNTPGGAIPFKIVFKQDSTKLTGTVKRRTGDAPLEGTIKDKDVKFNYTITYNDNALVLSVSATVSGDTMKGRVSFAGQADEEFSATRAKAP